jgi:hypothetical protein
VRCSQRRIATLEARTEFSEFLAVDPDHPNADEAVTMTMLEAVDQLPN